MFAAAGAGSAGIRSGGQALLRALPIEPSGSCAQNGRLRQIGSPRFRGEAKKRKPKNAAAEAKLDSDC